ncbi:hypothetical protein PLESTB_001298700 [Pleodorina starrii]|uniref:Uncharacterized protein n=1 Tax=Pleodorina starrii TaxID=330485 RepID=A0A9W6F6C2_9CHLO|nr:hypothetical protein PLESTM_000856600 [Pleodorina starrii]GLC57959.1 hypothetical protein PLESTB_001298700 [Pleodorina starrii]GLC76755.1 hypothetical protein PLESTF_001830100 [Pleodorina starrii]
MATSPKPLNVCNICEGGEDYCYLCNALLGPPSLAPFPDHHHQPDFLLSALNSPRPATQAMSSSVSSPPQSDIPEEFGDEEEEAATQAVVKEAEGDQPPVSPEVVTSQQGPSWATATPYQMIYQQQDDSGGGVSGAEPAAASSGHGRYRIFSEEIVRNAMNAGLGVQKEEAVGWEYHYLSTLLQLSYLLPTPAAQQHPQQHEWPPGAAEHPSTSFSNFRSRSPDGAGCSSSRSRSSSSSSSYVTASSGNGTCSDGGAIEGNDLAEVALNVVDMCRSTVGDLLSEVLTGTTLPLQAYLEFLIPHHFVTTSKVPLSPPMPRTHPTQEIDEVLFKMISHSGWGDIYSRAITIAHDIPATDATNALTAEVMQHGSASSPPSTPPAGTSSHGSFAAAATSATAADDATLALLPPPLLLPKLRLLQQHLSSAALSGGAARMAAAAAATAPPPPPPRSISSPAAAADSQSYETETGYDSEEMAFENLSDAVRQKIQSVLHTCSPYIKDEHFDDGVLYMLLQLQDEFGEASAVSALHCIETATGLAGIRRMRDFITTRLMDHQEHEVWKQDPRGYAQRQLTPDLIAVLEDMVRGDDDSGGLSVMRKLGSPNIVRQCLGSVCAAAELSSVVTNAPAHLYTMLFKRLSAIQRLSRTRAEEDVQQEGGGLGGGFGVVDFGVEPGGWYDGAGAYGP